VTIFTTNPFHPRGKVTSVQPLW